MRLYKSFIVLCTLMLSIANSSFAQQGNIDLPQSSETLVMDSCEFLVSSDSAFASISVLEESPQPGPVNITIKFQIEDSKPCVMESVTPTKLFFPKRMLEVRVSRKEGEPNIRFFLNDKNGMAKGMNRGVVHACAKVDESWQLMVGCGGF